MLFPPGCLTDLSGCTSVSEVSQPSDCVTCQSTPETPVPMVTVVRPMIAHSVFLKHGEISMSHILGWLEVAPVGLSRRFLTRPDPAVESMNK